MIRLLDASKLAYTKLRTRRIRLVITIFVSALIFSGLIAASFISNGVFHSIQSFGEEGFGSRYVMSAYGNSKVLDPSRESSVLKRAAELQKNLVEKKKKEAKRLGIVYDPLSETPAVETIDGPNGKEKTLNILSPASTKAIAEFMAKNPIPGIKELKQKGESYGAVGYYESIGLSFGGIETPNLAVLKDGKEEFTNENNKNFGPSQRGTDSFTGSWQLMSKGLLEPFLLPGQSTEVDEGILPVIAPYSAVEQLLGMQTLPPTAKPSERLERLKEVREKAGDLSFSVCYRNETSTELISQTIATKQEIDQNKNKKDFIKPKLIYKLPKNSCGPVLIEVDKRTDVEKKLAEKETQFRRMFGEPVPKEVTLKFKVIGIGPDPLDFSAPTFSGLLSGFLSSNLGQQTSWLTPIESRKDEPLLKKVFPEKPTDISQIPYNYIELPDAATARTFLKQENCEPDFGSFSVSTGGPEGSSESSENPYKQCINDGKLFTVYPFGSNSLALEEAKKSFAKVFRIAAIVITIAAAIIMIGTVGRVIADSRRETAVFRAIGAKRLDIAQIYFTYTVFLAGLIAFCTMIIGFILASVANSRWSESLTIDALVAYNAQDLSRQFSLFGLNGTQLLIIVGLIFLAGLASAILPLLSNIRRNPIRDMRDEN